MVDITEVVTRTNFGDHRLRGFWGAGGQICPFLIDFHRRPYNTLALPCERVIMSQNAHIGPRHRQLLDTRLSNLSFIPKLLERFVSKHFTSDVDLHTLLPAHQSPYRPFHSTETAVLSVHDDLVRAVDDCRVFQLVLLDVSASFDTVRAI